MPMALLAKLFLNMSENFTERMQKICECGHSRGMHHYGFSRIPEGQEIQSMRTDVECKVEECGCGTYSSAGED